MTKIENFDHVIIEKKWQEYWKDHNVFATTNNHKKNKYVLDMFPYPSGAGLHVGHPIGYTATDILSRYYRLNSYDVLHPMGWDAFGLPAEQYALKTGKHPEEFTLKNIENFKRQIMSLGFSYDWDKEVNTSDKNYYKWTQWIFRQMYKKGLASLEETEVNWCQDLGTVLANEEIIVDKNGNRLSERGNFPVTRRRMKQWVLKITQYADKLLAGLDDLKWTESLKNLQRNWIGRKEENGKVYYHLKDWIFARQRYWGEPFPLAYDKDGNIYLIEDLVELPYTTNIKPSGNGESPLSNLDEWLFIEKDDQKLRRETSTMPQWAGSCWYYLAYIIKNPDGSMLPLNSPEAMERFKKWLPVDVYVGGQEHAVMHLLYARFWHKVLYDLGIVPTEEPFYKLVNQGMVLGPDNQKMSKSKGNVINPDDVISEYGADTLRVYEMFMGAFWDDKSWSHEGINGINRWLQRVYRLIKEKSQDASFFVQDDFSETWNLYHRLVRGVSKNIVKFKFNLAISMMMVFVNHLYKVETIPSRKILVDFAILLSPFAPHLAEELLAIMHHKSLEHQKWPTYDKSKITKKTVNYALSVNSKVRSIMTVDLKMSKKEIIKLALKDEKIATYLDNKEPQKIIFVKDKIINFLL